MGDLVATNIRLLSADGGEVAQKTESVSYAPETLKSFEELKREKEKSKAVEGSVKKRDEARSKHTNVKAAGVKSVFSVEDDVLITSFGRGNSAVIENVEDLKSDKIQTKINLKESENSKKYEVENNVRTVKGLADNPTKIEAIAPGETQIGFKTILEEHFFGRTFNDNIHIQIIHNILDIKKILAVHSNNIVYALDNIHERGRENQSGYLSDLIGAGGISVSKTYEYYCNNQKSGYENSFLKEFVDNERISYFGNAFYKDAGSKKIKRSEEEIYYILAMLNEVRNVSTHFTEEAERNWARANLYELENTRLSPEAKEVLNTIYKEKVNTLDAESFIKKAKVRDLGILFRALSIKENEKSQLIADLYNFSIKKNYKNIGFSIKTLREDMLKISNSPLCETSVENNAVRPKAYKLYDFIIWNYYNKNPEKADAFVNLLRTKTKNEEKEKVYYDEATRTFKEICDSIRIMTDMVSHISEKSEVSIDKQQMKNYVAKIESLSSAENVSGFSKIIYLVTLFLDGKEINDLLTTLVNKFDNIASLLSVLEKQSGKKVEFSREYAFFNSANMLGGNISGGSENYTCKVVEELREINSFARMTGDSKIRKSAFEDAAQLLGYHDETVNSLFEVLRLKELDGKGWKKRPEDEHQEYNSLLEKHCYFKKDKKCIDSGLRNFIINNVIESRRFNYIVRYADPERLKKCTSNKELMKFAFKEVPDSQIDRYYISCYLVDSYRNGDKITNDKRKGLQEKKTRLIFDTEKLENAIRNYTQQKKKHKKNNVKRK